MLGSPVKVDKVLVGERRHAQSGARDVDALVRPDPSRQRDLETGPAGTALDHVHRDGPIGEQDALADLQVVGQSLVGAGQLMGIIARLGFGGQAELGPEVAFDDVAGDVPKPDLGPAEVLEHRELTSRLLADRTDRLERGRVLIMRGVREVEPEDVHPRLDQLPEHGRISRRRPDSRHDLGADLAERLKVCVRHGCHRKASVPRARGPSAGPYIPWPHHSNRLCGESGRQSSFYRGQQSQCDDSALRSTTSPVPDPGAMVTRRVSMESFVAPPSAGYLRPACPSRHFMLAKTRAWHPEHTVADLGPLSKLESIGAVRPEVSENLPI